MEEDMNAISNKTSHHGLGREGEHPQGDMGQLIILAVFMAVWALDSFVFRISTLPASTIPLGVRLGVSGSVFLAALRLAHRGHVVISEEVLRQGRLVRDGVFASVRHPLYLAALLFYVSLVVATASLISLALFGGVFAFYNFIAAYEERVLLDRYGDEYREYRRTVPKWIPRLRPAGFD
jgi:protein-S-isoprenylcysteine O-methyltransferase Ste14